MPTDYSYLDRYWTETNRFAYFIIDPYAGNPGVGRVRRLYVHPRYRGQGLGRLLMHEVEHHATESFAELRLFTDSSSASAFYECMGYQPITGNNKVSHAKKLHSM